MTVIILKRDDIGHFCRDLFLGRLILDLGIYPQADMPEAEKNRYIEAYEDTYISRIIEEQIGSYPRDRSREERSVWVHSKVELIEKYKEDHPDYKEQAKQHAIDNAQKQLGEELQHFTETKPTDERPSKRSRDIPAIHNRI